MKVQGGPPIDYNQFDEGLSAKVRNKTNAGQQDATKELDRDVGKQRSFSTKLLEGIQTISDKIKSAADAFFKSMGHQKPKQGDGSFGEGRTTEIPTNNLNFMRETGIPTGPAPQPNISESGKKTSPTGRPTANQVLRRLSNSPPTVGTDSGSSEAIKPPTKPTTAPPQPPPLLSQNNPVSLAPSRQPPRPPQETEEGVETPIQTSPPLRRPAYGTGLSGASRTPPDQPPQLPPRTRQIRPPPGTTQQPVRSNQDIGAPPSRTLPQPPQKTEDEVETPPPLPRRNTDTKPKTVSSQTETEQKKLLEEFTELKNKVLKNKAAYEELNSTIKKLNKLNEILDPMNSPLPSKEGKEQIPIEKIRKKIEEARAQRTEEIHDTASDWTSPEPKEDIHTELRRRLDTFIQSMQELVEHTTKLEKYASDLQAPETQDKDALAQLKKYRVKISKDLEDAKEKRQQLE